MSKKVTDKDMFQYYLSEIAVQKKHYDDVKSRYFSLDIKSIPVSELEKETTVYDDVIFNYDAFCRVFADFVVKHADRIKFE